MYWITHQRAHFKFMLLKIDIDLVKAAATRWQIDLRYWTKSMSDTALTRSVFLSSCSFCGVTFACHVYPLTLFLQEETRCVTKCWDPSWQNEKKGSPLLTKSLLHNFNKLSLGTGFFCRKVVLSSHLMRTEPASGQPAPTPACRSVQL